jgi:hypothetical protein
MSTVSRGFKGRRRPSVELPPGQYLVQDWSRPPSGSRGVTLGPRGRVGSARGPTGWADGVKARWLIGYAGRPP